MCQVSISSAPSTWGWPESMTRSSWRGAAAEGRILLTHDVNTIPRFPYERVRSGLTMPGVFLIGASMPIGQSIDELTFVMEGSTPEEWNDLVTYFPL